MSATANLIFVVAASIAPVGVIPLGVWLHDRICDTRDALSLLVDALACGLLADTFICMLLERGEAGAYRGADAD